ncbi:MAG: hypothetical protein ABEK59_03820 [Halobacteria archaeon]
MQLKKLKREQNVKGLQYKVSCIESSIEENLEETEEQEEINNFTGARIDDETYDDIHVELSEQRDLLQKARENVDDDESFKENFETALEYINKTEHEVDGLLA